MSQQPPVSILIVCHNDWPDLELAIESALSQSYPNLEVIVVDNASTDDTESQIRARYSEKVQYIRQENLGAAGGRNTAMKASSGEYLQLLDGDDLLAPNKIQKQMDYCLEHPDVDVVYGRFRCFRSTPNVAAESLYDCDAEEYEDMKALLLERCPGPPITFLFKRSVVDRIGYQDSLYFEDYEYWLRAAFADCKFAFTPDCWSFYRRRFGQKSEHLMKGCQATLSVLSRASQYVQAEPYKTKLVEKIAKLRYAFGHYYLWKGDRRRASGYLRKAVRECPSDVSFPQANVAQWLARVPAGPLVYGMMRRAKGLRPPFAHLEHKSG